MKQIKAIKTKTQYILPADRVSYDQMISQISRFVEFNTGEVATKFTACALLKVLGIDPHRRPQRKPSKVLLGGNDVNITAEEFGSQLESVCEKHHGRDPFDHDDMEFEADGEY